jgi:ssDNA-binding Zn-finger/Zn-ribbon topoisomerase 1
MAFARCPNCEYVQWQLGITDKRPTGECPECGWEMHRTLTPVGSGERAAFQEREEIREAAGLRE